MKTTCAAYNGIYRRAFVSRVRLYQAYIFSYILRTQQRLVELALCPICQDSWLSHAHTYIIPSHIMILRIVYMFEYRVVRIVCQVRTWYTTRHFAFARFIFRTKKQVLTHCCAATGSIVGVSEFSFGLFSYFSSPSGIYRRAFVSCVRLYQV